MVTDQSPPPFDTQPHPDFSCPPCVKTLKVPVDKPNGLLVDSGGKLLVAESYSHLVRLITNTGSWAFAGTGLAGFKNGPAKLAQFALPMGVAMDSAGQVFVADQDNDCVRVISGHEVATLAGSGLYGFLDGAAATARFRGPAGVAVDAKGNVYVADHANHRIRVVSGNVVSTLAGSGLVGLLDGAAATAKFNSPSSVAVDKGKVYVADYANHCIRVVSGNPATGYSVDTLAGSGLYGFQDGPAASARFRYPNGVAVDSAGKVYVADMYNHRIRVIVGNMVSTLAGSGTPGLKDGAGGSAQFDGPTGVAVDSAGTVYVADKHNDRIRVIRQ